MTNANRPTAQDHHPDILSVHAQRQRKIFFALCAVGLCILVGFSIVSYIEKNVSATWTHIVMVSIVAGAALALLLGIENLKVYRFACWGISIGLCCLAALGSGFLYYHLVLPLLMFFCLGRREGTLGAGVFFFGMAVLMLAPGLVVGHVYPIGSTLRFLIGYLFVTLVGWNYEESREQFYGLLTTKNEQLQSEKEQLKDALSQVRETEARLEQTNTELRNQTQLMETVFNSMSEGIVVVDATGRQLLNNPSAERISGMGMVPSEPSEWAKIYGIFYPDRETYVPTDQNPLVRAMRGESTDDFEAFVLNEKNPDGVYVIGSGRPVLSNETKEIKAGVFVFRDITQLKQTGVRLEQTNTELRNQAQLMETIFNSISDGVIAVDENGEYLIFNPSAKHIAGMYVPDAGLGKRPETYGLYLPDGETRFPADELPLARAIRGEATDGIDQFIRNQERPEGVYISVSGRPLRDDSGRAKGGVIVFRDITETKRVEAQLEQTITELQDQARLMETVFNSMHEGILIFDATGRQLFRNPSSVRISGKGMVPSQPDEWAEIYGIFYPDQKTYIPADENPLVRAMRGESTEDFEAFLCNEERPDGVHVIGEGRSIRDTETNEVKAAVLVFRDITKLKETEAELRRTVLKLQDQTRLMETVFNSISDGVVVTDEEGKFLFINPAAEQIVGRGATDAPSDQWAETYGTFYPDRKTPFPSSELPLVRAMHGESLDDIELFIRNQERPQGTSISVSARPLQDDLGMIEGGVIVLRDITKLKATESELRRTVRHLQDQTHLMETIFNSISDGVVVADENGNLTIFNPSAERMVGIGMTGASPDHWTDQYGIFFPDRETPVPMEELPLVRAIRGEASDEVEMFVRNPKVPEGVYISVSGRPLHDDSGITKGGVSVFRDVTERIRAEEALSQAFAHGRLEIVDTILHNIGNAINSVATGVGTIYGQLAQNELVHRLSALAEAIEAHRDDWIPYLKTDPQGQKVMPFILALAKDFATQNAQLTQTVERVEDRVAHIVDIIRTQRSLSREVTVRKDVNLRKAITEAVKLLQDSLAKRGIQVHIDCQNAPKEIRIQESKFHQMLVNLIKNAIEAIDDLEKLDGLEVKPSIQIRSYVQGDFLVLDVIDNGIGIEVKRSKIIFAAGYTTKEGGSGLGLHSIANFIIGSGGQIHPLSAGTGQGTTMRVKLRLPSVALKPEAEGGTLP